MSADSWRKMTGGRSRFFRLVIAALFVVPVLVGSISTASVAAPSKEDVEAAKAKLRDLGHRLEIVIEQYNDATWRLEQAEQRLAQAQEMKQRYEAEAEAARGRLEERAVEAYTGMGSQLDVLLEAQSFTEFSDRLEFMGALAQSDADLATVADAARQKAEWAARQYNAAVEERESQLAQMKARISEIQTMLDEQEQLYQQTNAEYQDYLARQRAAAEAAALAAAAPAPIVESGGGDTTGGGGGTDGGGGDGGGYVPPPDSSGAAVAIDAAKSVLGTQYVWGSADPDVGFDCSGLTMWAWAQAGVSLPHSSQAQYDYLPRVPSTSQAQPGDLLFFYSPISHVAMYLGGGMMIHARHPGPGGEVQIGSVSGYGTSVTGITRPG